MFIVEYFPYVSGGGLGSDRVLPIDKAVFRHPFRKKNHFEISMDLCVTEDLETFKKKIIFMNSPHFAPFRRNLPRHFALVRLCIF